ASRGWGVRVATARLRGDPPVGRMGPVVVEGFACLDLLSRLASVPVPLMSPVMLGGLFRAAREVDVIVVHGHVYVGSLYAAVAARRSGTPMVLIQHSPFVRYGPALDRLERLVDRTVGRWVIRSARSVVA